jgi:Lon-like ATP-dependent protease
MSYDNEISGVLADYCSNGRDTVNIIQAAASVAYLNKRRHIRTEDVYEVIDGGRYEPIPLFHALEKGAGVAMGMALDSSGNGMIYETEAAIMPFSGKNTVTGGASAVLDITVTVMSRLCGINLTDKSVHINYPGGITVDGPSSGLAVFCALYSAYTNKKLPRDTALTGEITLNGCLNNVGGIGRKIEAASRAGFKRVVIPSGNYNGGLARYGVEIVCVKNVHEAIEALFKAVPCL